MVQNNACNYQTTLYSVLLGASNNLINNLANGTTGQFLGANTGTNPSWQTVAESSGAMQSLISGWSDSITISQNTTRFFPLIGGSTNPTTTTQPSISCVMTKSGTIKNLYLITAQAPGAGQTYTFNIAKNGTAQSMAATIADAAKTGNDTSNSFTVVAGDYLELYTTLSATATALVQASWSVGFLVT